MASPDGDARSAEEVGLWRARPTGERRYTAEGVCAPCLKNAPSRAEGYAASCVLQTGPTREPEHTAECRLCSCPQAIIDARRPGSSALPATCATFPIPHLPSLIPLPDSGRGGRPFLAASRRSVSPNPAPLPGRRRSHTDVPPRGRGSRAIPAPKRYGNRAGLR